MTLSRNVRIASCTFVLCVLALLAPAYAQSPERSFLYCVASASEPGGKAYFTGVYPGTWEQSADDEDSYFGHVSAKLDDGVERSTTYCYVLDTFDEAGLDRDEGKSIVSKQGWEPVDVTWRP